MGKARRAAGITNGQMARHLLRDRRTITNYEQGHTKPTERVLRAWAERCGVSYEWLVGVDVEEGTPRIHGTSSPHLLTAIA